MVVPLAHLIQTVGIAPESQDRLADRRQIIADRIAQYAAQHTERLGFLIAHRPGFVAPTLAARKIATFDHLTEGRIALHIIANTLYGLVKKDPLIRAMITGKKPAGPYEDAREAAIIGQVWLRAGFCLAAAAAIVLGGIMLAGGRLFY